MQITYDELRRIHRLEKNTSKLVEVDEDFIDSLEKFVEEEKKSKMRATNFRIFFGSSQISSLTKR